MSYEVKVGGESIFSLSEEDLDELDLIEKGEKAYHILYKDASYRISVMGFDKRNKSLTLKINDDIHHVEINTELDKRIVEMGLNELQSSADQDLLSPMPGLVLSIEVEEGQMVKKGDALLILEAMKMENVLKAELDGQVGNLEVAEGDTVEKGAFLLKVSADSAE